MKHFAIFLCINPFFPLLGLSHAEEYRISLLSDDKEIAEIELSIEGDAAVTKVGDATERFDLKGLRWQHDESKQWVTLTQCKTWAQQSREKSGESKTPIPEKIRQFIQWSLDPQFEITAEGDTLTFISGQVDYKITVEKPNRDLTNYYRYARLNAYKKAMTTRKLPPFAELKVLDELEQRKLMLKSMDVQIPGVDGAPSLRMVVTEDAQ